MRTSPSPTAGATLGLVFGEQLAGQVLTGEQPPLLAPFHPDRFAPVPL